MQVSKKDDIICFLAEKTKQEIVQNDLELIVFLQQSVIH